MSSRPIPHRTALVYCAVIAVPAAVAAASLLFRGRSRGWMIGAAAGVDHVVTVKETTCQTPTGKTRKLSRG